MFLGISRSVRLDDEDDDADAEALKHSVKSSNAHFAGAFGEVSDGVKRDLGTSAVKAASSTETRKKARNVVSDGVVLKFIPNLDRMKTGHCFKDNLIVECFEPTADVCQTKAQRKALVNAFDFFKPLNLDAFDRTHAGSLRTHLEDMAEMAKNHSADHILLVPQGQKRTYENETMEADLIQMGLKFVEVPWAVPPNLSPSIPINSGGCCGAREFIKLHAFNLTQYEAVVFYDTDISFNKFREWPEGVISPLFDCAASNYFMTASAMPFNGVNGGFFAVKPNHELFQAALQHLQNSYVDTVSGWNGQGWGPGRSISQWRMQGFLENFMYQSDHHEPYTTPKQLDPCVWDRQEYTDCNGNSSLGNCKEVSRVLHHLQCL